MTSMSHEPAAPASWPTWRVVLSIREMWASLAIAVVWLSVLFTAVWGPNIVSSTGAGTNTSTVPSAVVVALFAFFATWVIAKHGYGRGVEHKR
jgi:hypothetical protein